MKGRAALRVVLGDVYCQAKGRAPILQYINWKGMGMPKLEGISVFENNAKSFNRTIGTVGTVGWNIIIMVIYGQGKR